MTEAMRLTNSTGEEVSAHAAFFLISGKENHSKRKIVFMCTTLCVNAWTLK